jgi:Ca-activated chloride channel family protein
MRVLPGLLFCLLFASTITSAAAQAAPQAVQTSITVTVTDRHHRPVTGLKSEDFTLYEDGQRQPILSVTSDLPACIGLLVDKSGSMRGKHEAIASAMAGFMTGGNPGSQVFVVLFNDDPMLEQDFTRDSGLIERAIARANARGGTAMYDAIIASVDHLAENKTCGKRVLMIVFDGEDNESRKSLDYTLHALQTAGNPLVYAIALPHPNGPSTTRGQRALEALTGPSGGAMFFAGDSGEVRKIALKVAEEFRRQYGISYARTKTGHRDVKVEAHASGQEGLAVRVNVASEPNLPAASATAQ